MPGAEGDVVAAVQEALIAADVEVAGGADGVYGDDTMLAVAEYQRRDDTLEETGAVDVATARSLGVYRDPQSAAETAAAAVPSTAVVATTTVPAPAGADRATAGTTGGGDGGAPRWALVVATALVVVVAGVVARRRYVVAQRAKRRWARVHPSTSPRRSVADLRRAGQIYDHQLEEPAALDV